MASQVICFLLEQHAIQNLATNRSDLEEHKQNTPCCPTHQAQRASDLCMGVPLHSSKKSKRPLTPILLNSIAIHLTCLLLYFCKRIPSSWQKSSIFTTSLHHDTPPVCIAMPFAEALGSGVIGTHPRMRA